MNYFSNKYYLSNVNISKVEKQSKKIIFKNLDVIDVETTCCTKNLDKNLYVDSDKILNLEKLLKIFNKKDKDFEYLTKLLCTYKLEFQCSQPAIITTFSGFNCNSYNCYFSRKDLWKQQKLGIENHSANFPTFAKSISESKLGENYIFTLKTDSEQYKKIKHSIKIINFNDEKLQNKKLKTALRFCNEKKYNPIFDCNDNRNDKKAMVDRKHEHMIDIDNHNADNEREYMIDIDNYMGNVLVFQNYNPITQRVFIKKDLYIEKSHAQRPSGMVLDNSLYITLTFIKPESEKNPCSNSFFSISFKSGNSKSEDSHKIFFDIKNNTINIYNFEKKSFDTINLKESISSRDMACKILNTCINTIYDIRLSSTSKTLKKNFALNKLLFSNELSKKYAVSQEEELNQKDVLSKEELFDIFYDNTKDNEINDELNQALGNIANIEQAEDFF